LFGKVNVHNLFNGGIYGTVSTRVISIHKDDTECYQNNALLCRSLSLKRVGHSSPPFNCREIELFTQQNELNQKSDYIRGGGGGGGICGGGEKGS
jgi:hypothetical protein